MTITNDQGLTNEHIEILRGGYSPEGLVAATGGALNQAYPPGHLFVDGVVQSLYQPEPVSPMNRERCLIVLLGARQEKMNLGIHIYWGLMEGLSLEEVGHALLMVGAYSGIPAYSTGMVVYRKTCATLKRVAEAGGSGLAPLAVAGAIMKEFGA